MPLVEKGAEPFLRLLPVSRNTLIACSVPCSGGLREQDPVSALGETETHAPPAIPQGGQQQAPTVSRVERDVNRKERAQMRTRKCQSGSSTALGVPDSVFPGTVQGSVSPLPAPCCRQTHKWTWLYPRVNSTQEPPSAHSSLSRLDFQREPSRTRRELQGTRFAEPPAARGSLGGTGSEAGHPPGQEAPPDATLNPEGRHRFRKSSGPEQE